MTAEDAGLIGRVVSKLRHPPTYAERGVHGSILIAAAGSYGAGARTPDDLTQPTGFDPEAVGHMSLRVFNRKPDALTREEASSLIRELSNLKRRVA